MRGRKINAVKKLKLEEKHKTGSPSRVLQFHSSQRLQQAHSDSKQYAYLEKWTLREFNRKIKTLLISSCNNNTAGTITVTYHPQNVSEVSLENANC